MIKNLMYFDTNIDPLARNCEKFAYIYMISLLLSASMLKYTLDKILKGN